MENFHEFDRKPTYPPPGPERVFTPCTRTWKSFFSSAHISSAEMELIKRKAIRGTPPREHIHHVGVLIDLRTGEMEFLESKVQVQPLNNTVPFINSI